MNRIDRLTAILIQLQSKKIVTANEIAKRFSISLRTVYRDIRALEEAGVPIGAEAGKGYFILEGYFLPPVMFTEEEAGAVLMGAKLIESMSDKSVGKNFSSAMFKIKSVLKSSGKETLENLEARIAVSNIFKGIEKPDYLSELQKAVAEKIPLNIKYYSHYRENTTKRIIEPIGLYHYSSAWHLIAYCRMRKDYRDFRIDRIKSIEKLNEKFQIQNHKSLDEYIKSTNNLESDIKFAEIEFSNEAAKIITDIKYYYGFIEEIKGKNYTKMKFIIIDADYLVRWLVTFGKEVKIISPDELLAKAEKFVKEISKYYL